jgi:thiamine pyridinylase
MAELFIPPGRTAVERVVLALMEEAGENYSGTWMFPETDKYAPLWWCWSSGAKVCCTPNGAHPKELNMRRISVFLLLFVALVFGAMSAARAATLRVALYPFVPRYDQFKSVIEQRWKALEPAVPIIWVPKADWDGGYDKDPDPGFDIYVFDAINIDYFRTHNWLLGLQPSEVENFGDFIAYAADGVKNNGLIYALPQLGCGSILFYEKTDNVLASATTLGAVTAALGRCSYYGETPPDKSGLMLDLAGGTTNASTYIESAHERLNQYPVPLPPNDAQVDKASIANIQQVLATASFKNAYYSGANDYQRAAWFNAGQGRGYIGFTESLSQLSPSRLQQVAFKPMPWSDNPQGNKSPLFYSDVIGIQPATVERGTRALAIKLANLMASTDVMSAAIGPQGTDGPQYLMPVRHSVFKALSASDPIYQQMYGMVTGASPILFNLGPTSKDWLRNMKSNIRNMIAANPACYTDIQAGPIASNVAAQTACPAVCSKHGGWSGQWTTTIPGVMSVCGCNTPRP